MLIFMHQAVLKNKILREAWGLLSHLHAGTVSNGIIFYLFDYISLSGI